MSKIVRMVVEVDVEKCTGCNLCSRVCPTSAFTLRDRLPDEPGKSRKIVELETSACYNAQRCLELCPDDALTMVELREPFEIRTDTASVDQQALAELCKKSGFAPRMMVCPCTGTTMGELAAAILLGADTPDKLSRATGVRTGCSELCMHPVLSVLAAAGHAGAPKNPEKGYQWYSKTATLFEHVGPDGKFPAELQEAYPTYSLDREVEDMAKLYKRG